jgi:hypothetical protein
MIEPTVVEQPAAVEPVIETVKFHELFAKPLVVSTTNYAFHVLLYMQRRPELELAEVGLTSVPFFQNIHRVQDKFIRSYYQYLSGMVRPLIRYASLEESCSMSGAYNEDRLKTVESVRTALLRFDNPDDPRVYGYLTSMLEQPQ